MINQFRMKIKKFFGFTQSQIENACADFFFMFFCI